MAQTQIDWPYGTGGPGSGSVQYLRDMAMRQGLAWAIGNVIGVAFYVFGTGKIKAFGAVIVLVPFEPFSLLLGNGVIVVLEKTGIMTGQQVVSETMWIGPGTVFYVR